MILRRFMMHVSEQNWLAVVLDFAIVVLVYFIDIQSVDTTPKNV